MQLTLQERSPNMMEGAPLFVEDDDSDDGKESPKPLDNKSESLASAQKPELSVVEVEPVPEAEAPLEQIGEAEVPVIERQLTIAAQEIDTEQAHDGADPEIVAGDQAVEHFRELIIENGQDSDTALRETLGELGEPTEFEETSLAETENYQEEAGEQLSEEVEDNQPESDDNQRPARPKKYKAWADGLASGPNSTPHKGFSNFSPSMPKFPNIEAANDQTINPVAAAVTGAVVGYLVGRRKGRIKTEGKLLPIQQKLEKQVNNLGQQLKQKEETIRTVAAQKVRTEGISIAEKLPAQKEIKAKQPEHIGHVLVNAPETSETKVVDQPAEKFELTEEQSKSIAGKRIENLSRAELLVLSEKINVEGTSLRQIYETRLLGERGLRRLVAEHLRGGDLSKALKREIVEREIDFERDPAIRDIVPTQAVSSDGSGASNALNDLLKAAKVDVSDGAEEVAFFRARSRYEAGQLHKHQQQRRIMNISFVVIILMLVLAIIILYATRS